MIKSTNRFVLGDSIVTVSIDEEPRTIDFDDIVGRGESDDWSGYAPWEECDGWEHEIDSVESFHDADLDDLRECRGYVRGERYHNGRIVSIDDDTVINRWGCDGYHGCSKQVRAESIARAKRKATEQLVKWYTDGWYVSLAIAEYGDYVDSVGGIYDEPWGDYTEECILECRREVAAQMESDGYIVENQPEPSNPYNAVDSFRDRIRRNLDCS